jgi:crotonobetainyl-CoA:carnitine CoA-transferase CaiB-like acyl-CoA transferase
LTRALAGPYCTLMLGDMGADVVKIELPGAGDETRQWGPPFLAGESSYFMSVNRNKRSVTLDLKSPSGLEAVRRLTRSADVLVENFRPGTMDGLDLGYERLSAINPRLIYVAVSGFGQDGPRSRLAGLDLIGQAMGGLMSIAGEPRGDPDRRPTALPIPVVDLGAGMFATIGALGALQARSHTGVGQFVDVSLLETAVALSMLEVGDYFSEGKVAGPKEWEFVVRAADGWFVVRPVWESIWPRFCSAIGLDQLAQDPRFATPKERTENRAELVRLIEEVTKTASQAHWSEVFDRAGVPCGAIRTYDQVCTDPELIARDFFVDLAHPTLGVVRQAASPIRFSGTPVNFKWSGARLGEHSMGILEDLGYSDEERGRLAASGVVRVPDRTPTPAEANPTNARTASKGERLRT